MESKGRLSRKIKAQVSYTVGFQNVPSNFITVVDAGTAVRHVRVQLSVKSRTIKGGACSTLKQLKGAAHPMCLIYYALYFSARDVRILTLSRSNRRRILVLYGTSLFSLWVFKGGLKIILENVYIYFYFVLYIEERRILRASSCWNLIKWNLNVGVSLGSG